MTVVEEARGALGPVGAFLPVFGAEVPVGMQRVAARRLEVAGFRSVWTNEIPGKDALVEVAVLLAATERITFGTCVANIWVRPPQTAHDAARQLAEAYPGRFVLGLGVGHPQQAELVGREYGRPLSTMRDYLHDMASPASYARIIAANGPRMLSLASDAADGALPASVSPDFTAGARRTLGPDKLLVVYVDVSATAGAAGEVTEQVRAHLDAGADHVVGGCPLGSDFAATVDRLEEIAPDLLGST